MVARTIFVLFALFWAGPALAAETPLENAPGWTIRPAFVSSGATLSPATENQYVYLKPPELGTEVAVGQSLIDAIIRGEITAQEVYDFAVKKAGASLDKIAKKDTPAPATVAAAAPPPPAAVLKEENLWDLGKPLATPPVGSPAPPPEGALREKFKAAGTPRLSVYHPPELPKWSCHRLKAGETTLVRMGRAGDKEDSPTTVEASYRLRRESELHYVAEINFKFVKGNGFDLPFKDEEIDPHYRALFNECFRTYNPMLKNPFTHASLELRLTRDPAVPEEKIEIVGANARSNSRAYESGATCPVVMHEVMHQLGLVDEYEERWDDFSAALVTPMENTETGAMWDEIETFESKPDCRAVAPEDSLMNWHDLAARRSQPTNKVSVAMCLCLPKVDCRALAARSDGKHCPEGSVPWRKLQAAQAGDEVRTTPTARAFQLTEGTHEVIGQDEPERASLLYPAHFRAITEPGCDDVNLHYYACARNAYRHSKPLPDSWKKRGFERLPSEGCEAPVFCRDGSNEWLQ